MDTYERAGNAHRRFVWHPTQPALPMGHNLLLAFVAVLSCPYLGMRVNTAVTFV